MSEMAQNNQQEMTAYHIKMLQFNRLEAVFMSLLALFQVFVLLYVVMLLLHLLVSGRNYGMVFILCYILC